MLEILETTKLKVKWTQYAASKSRIKVEQKDNPKREANKLECIHLESSDFEFGGFLMEGK